MSRVGKYFNTQLSFSGEGERPVNLVSRTLNSVANGFFKPLSYLAGGIDVVDSNRSQDKFEARFTRISKDHPIVKGFKGLASFIVFIPGGILGLLFKGIALCSSPALRDEYQAFDGHLETLKDELVKELQGTVGEQQGQRGSTPRAVLQSWLASESGIIDYLLDQALASKNQDGQLIFSDEQQSLFRGALNLVKECQAQAGVEVGKNK